jgi:hypothetical protein
VSAGLITITAAMTTLILVSLALFAQVISATAAWPAGITISWTVSYTTTHRKGR